MMANKKRKNSRNNSKWHELIWEMFRYGVTGNVWFWSGYLTFFVCDKGLGLSLWWATIISNLVGWSLNFVLEHNWVFTASKQDKITNVSIRYIIYTALNFVLTYYILYGLKSIGITPYIGQFISAGFFTIWNYIWYKSWVFKGKPVKVSARSRTNKRHAK